MRRRFSNEPLHDLEAALTACPPEVARTLATELRRLTNVLENAWLSKANTIARRADLERLERDDALRALVYTRLYDGADPAALAEEIEAATGTDRDWVLAMAERFDKQRAEIAREREVMQLYRSGYRNREIAARLKISERTVKRRLAEFLARPIR